MPFKVQCGSCSAVINAPDAAAGKQVKCPKCQTPILLPEAQPVEPAPDRAVSPASSAVAAGSRTERQRGDSGRAAARRGRRGRRDDDEPDDERRPRRSRSQFGVAHSLGIGSLVISVLSFFVCWVPFLGAAVSGLGLLLGVGGLGLAFARRGAGLGFSIVGAGLSAFSLATALIWTFAPSNAFLGSQQDSPTQVAGLPTDQANFVTTIRDFSARYRAAPNEIQKTELRFSRASALEKAFGQKTVTDWRGTLKRLSTTRDGTTSVRIAIKGSNNIAIGSTSIERGSALYDELAKMVEGQAVTFSGEFQSGKRDYLEESSLSESGAMTDPEFVMRMTGIRSQ